MIAKDLGNQREMIEDNKCEPMIFFFDEKKVMMVNAPIVLDLGPTVFRVDDLPILRVCPEIFNTFEALSWADELIHRFSIPRERIAFGQMPDEDYKRYIGSLFDKICIHEYEFHTKPHGFSPKTPMYSQGALSDLEIVWKTADEFCSLSDGRLCRINHGCPEDDCPDIEFTFPAYGILSYDKQDLITYLKPELIRLCITEKDWDKVYARNILEGQMWFDWQLIWEVTFSRVLDDKTPKYTKRPLGVRIVGEPVKVSSYVYKPLIRAIETGRADKYDVNAMEKLLLDMGYRHVSSYINNHRAEYLSGALNGFVLDEPNQSVSTEKVHISNKVRIKDKPSHMDNNPYAGQIGSIVGYHNSICEDYDLDHDQYIITIKQSDGTLKSARIDIDDVEFLDEE